MTRSMLLVGISALTYASAAAAQQVPAGQAASPQPESAAAPAGQEIIVTGIRESLERAAEIKRDAPQVVDSIVSQDIGKFPDPSTAAALQRVPGVQVSVSQSNEIGDVKIRGLGDIMTTLDGREIITGTGRQFSLQDLPADALARVDVVKTNTADMIEGGVAGTIDLELNKPFNFRKPTIVASARGTYGIKADRLDPQLNLLATKTWHTGIGDIGVLLNGSWSQTHYNHPRTREGVRRSGETFPPAGSTTNPMPFSIPGALIPNVVESHSNYGEYQRPEVNGSVQWQANDHLQIYADGLYTGYRSKSQWSLANAQLFMPGTSVSDVELSDQCITARSKPNGQSPLPSVDANGNPTLPYFHVQHLCALSSATFSNVVSEQKTYTYNDRTDGWLGALGAKYDSDNAHVKGEVSYQRSIAKDSTFLVALGQRIPTFKYTADTGHGAAVETPGDPYLSTDNLVFDEGLDQDYNRSKGTLFQTRLDSTLDIDSSVLSKFQFGARYSDHKAEYQQAVVNTPAPGGVIGSDTEDKAIRVIDSGLPDDFLSTMPGVPNFAGGKGALVPNPNYIRTLDGRNAVREFYGLPDGDPAYQPQRRFYANEKTLAAYAQLGYKVNLGGDMVLDGLVGVRPTRTERTMEGSSVITIPATATEPKHTEIVPLSRNTTDTDILPNASARLRFGGGLQVRATYAETIRRPDFGSLNPGLTYALSTNPNLLNSGSAGNPDLSPEKSESYDASLEYYFKHGFAAVAVYKRDITGRIVSASAVENIGGIDYSISRPRNLGAAELKGVEVSGQMFFDFLPGAFSGLGVMGNFTYADSKIEGSDPLAGLPLQGVSKYNYTAGLLFEKAGISGRLVYTYRSRYYDGDATGGLGTRELVDVSRADDANYNPLLLNYVKPAGRLDFGLSWDVNKKLRLDVGGTNILGNKYQGYYNDPGITQEYRYDETTYTFGVRVRL